MIRMFHAIIITAVMGLPAYANTICDDLAVLAAQGPDVGLVRFDRGADCRAALAMSGVTNIHCSWTFPYRSDEATDAFDGLFDELTECLGPDATPTRDQSVNHPDAYDLRQFDLGGQAYAVSLKDKGALQQTLVFIRVQKVP